MNSYYAIFAKFSICTSPLCFISLQWGNNNDSNIQTTFPIQFTNSLYIVLVSLYCNPGIRDGASEVETYEHRLNGYKSWFGNKYGGNPDATLQHFYLVIGK